MGSHLYTNVMNKSMRKVRAFKSSRARKLAFSHYLEEQGFKIRGLTDNMASDLGVNPTAFRRAISLRHVDDPECSRIHLFSAQLARKLESLFNLPEGYLEGEDESTRALEPGTELSGDAYSSDEERYRIQADEGLINSTLGRIQDAAMQIEEHGKYPEAMRAAQILGAVNGHLEKLICDIWDTSNRRGADIGYVVSQKASYRRVNLSGIYRGGELMIPHFYAVISETEYGAEVKHRSSFADIMKSVFEQIMERNMYLCWYNGFELFNIVAYVERSNTIVSASYKLSDLGVIVAPSVVYPSFADRLEDHFVTNPSAPKIFREGDFEL